MPYEIKHNTPDKCVIKYVAIKHVNYLLWFNWGLWIAIILSIAAGLLAFAVFAIMGLALCSVILIFKKDKSGTRPEFEIELSRKDSLVSIKSTEVQNPNLTTYTLSSFRGFGIKESSFKHKSKSIAQAVVFIKLEPIRGIRRDIPLRNNKYIVHPDNAKKVVDVTNEWLKPTETISTESKAQTTNSPKEAAKVIRDFRDMDSD